MTRRAQRLAGSARLLRGADDSAFDRTFWAAIAAFNAAGASYLVVGAHAVAFFGEPRFTKDLNVWVDASPNNAERVMAALRAFGAPLDGVEVSDFSSPGVT